MNRNELKAKIAAQLLAPQMQPMADNVQVALDNGMDVKQARELSKAELEAAVKGCVAVAEMIMLECKL